MRWVKKETQTESIGRNGQKMALVRDLGFCNG
jgi:hypothetical protein